MSSLAVLTYHSLDESGSIISVAPGVFKEHVAWLADRGFTVVTLSEGLARLHDGGLARGMIALTFDDGFLNTVHVALPVLASRGFPATVFLVTDHVGQFNDWPAQGRAVPRLPLLDWSAAEELSAAGWEIGSHTQTHPDLTRLASDEVRSEVIGSREVLEQQLGVRVTTFAYPYGRYCDRVREIVGGAFASAVTTRLGVTRQGADLLTLERVDSYYLTHPNLFGLLESPWLPAYLAARQAIRDVRGAA